MGMTLNTNFIIHTDGAQGLDKKITETPAITLSLASRINMDRQG